MVHRAQILLAAAVASWLICSAAAPATAGDWYDFNNPLFSNYYVAAGSPAGVGAQLYVCPRPTPPLVGHTYVTYPPFAPDQFLYQHSDCYRRVNCDGSVTRTKICYSYRPMFCEHKPTVMWSRSTPCTPPVKAPSVFCMP